MALPGGLGPSLALTTPPESLIGYFVGWSISFVLTGATLTVFATYLTHFPTERTRYRLATSGSVLCVLSATVINMVSLVRMGVSADRSFAHLRALSVASDINPLVIVASALFSQGVLSERAFRLNSRNRWLLAWLVFCMVGEAGLGILATTERCPCPSPCSGLRELTPVRPADIDRGGAVPRTTRILTRALMSARVWMVVTDLCLVASLFVGLRRLARSLLDDAEYQGRGKRVMSRVWRTSVEAAVWPTLLCVATVVIAAAAPQQGAVRPSAPS